MPKYFRIIGFIGVVFLLWLVAAICMYKFIPCWSKRAAFGEMFGSVNSLFSGLALAGIIYTIGLQREQLKIQKEELEHTKAELKKSIEVQASTEKAHLENRNAQFLAAKLTALSAILSHLDSQVSVGKGIIKHYSLEDAQKTIDEIKKLIEKEENHE